ncbi:Membrane-bound lytic murein transglycosylase B [Nocardia amikacinitolerans]|uniref:Membrane-bound lytic murein transglycosylase B n=1 Tax=Nocardia amikacinitolerans TaxID=756689 RepID=A0A285L8C6_9NOCA|nr:lytic murein transglycosylase [Nocardia amikacinitolerans]MCP2274936.1 Membrane-bound lytic murein transglycosylase B [Nocardia amikacinitolerans]MCP2296321.1 Membrane-bound lytic murein transglycosylase B [Nocardia amikacinitolerans]MCP2316240.1 Membrane-bound lytic murein transglycosylase B [Nocardia amikacinitolerans]SNY80723.1 Membrane-bound lytic murein transglycosylase B [Nocardia amikacinitolerans]
MGRHRKQSPATVRRGSVIALTGLVPAGFVACAAASDLDSDQAAVQQIPDDQDALAAKPADSVEFVAHAMAEQRSVAPPIVKTVALSADREKADLPAGALGVPGVAIAAYQNAERTLDAENPTCNMPWNLLAGIGRVESTHAFGGKADVDGNPLSPVYGPVLDGSLAGNNVIHDSDDGALDGLGGYDRAVGPMQFLPETWKRYAADGNGDGIADPQNLYDAALTAGKYLCDGGLNMSDLAQQSRAILRYNNSMAYVANVMAWANSYGTGVAPKPAQLPRI